LAQSITNSNDAVTNFHGRRIANTSNCQLLPLGIFNLQKSDVQRITIGGTANGFDVIQLRTVRHGNGDFRGTARHNMAVGNHYAVIADNKARARPLAFLLLETEESWSRQLRSDS